MLAAVCVAPNSIAFSRLNSTGSMAMTAAPASLAPWMALLTDATAADHGHRVAGLHVGRVHGRAPTGDHAAAEQAGLVERQVLVDLDAAGLVDHGVVGERAEDAHQAEVAAVAAWWRGGAVGELQAVAVMAPMSHRLLWPVAQLGQRPQLGTKPNTTWSPGAS